MLFNSFEFLFLFLPVLLLVFFQLASRSQRAAAAWLALGSLFFYGWWNPQYLLLLLASIGFNFSVGVALVRGSEPRRRKLLLSGGVVANLLLLAYYKYANFFVDSVNVLAGSQLEIGQIILPLGISFFTFTQIAFLVDAASGKVRELDIVRYGLFVTYYPHLIAGPVLHHAEMMPQFGQDISYRPNREFMAVGATMFAIGLFKKVVLADGIAPYVGPAFQAVEQGQALGLLQAWGGALAYTLQLYFDFSGYSDMAIGLSYLIGVRLPLNFNSPYKARNIAEFWRCWHMTLSRFLRDYLYIPLGGNRKGEFRRYVNLAATMVLGGLWHGAGWTFVLWGALHGAYLVVHQLWQALLRRLGMRPGRLGMPGRLVSTALTFVAVVVGWVLFRAQSIEGAGRMLAAMAGMNGVSLPAVLGARLGGLGQSLQGMGVSFSAGGGVQFVMNYVWIIALLPIVFFSPNSQQIMRLHQPALLQHPEEEAPPSRLAWQPNRRWVLVMAAVLVLGLLSMSRPSEFLYFQF